MRTLPIAQTGGIWTRHRSPSAYVDLADPNAEPKNDTDRYRDYEDPPRYEDISLHTPLFKPLRTPLRRLYRGLPGVGQLTHPGHPIGPRRLVLKPVAAQKRSVLLRLASGAISRTIVLRAVTFVPQRSSDVTHAGSASRLALR